MNTDNKNFPEQDAPLKNTDNAFVQVGKDGQPIMPQTATDKKEAEESTAYDKVEKE